MVRTDCHTILFPPLTSAKKPCFYQKLSPKVLYFLHTVQNFGNFSLKDPKSAGIWDKGTRMPPIVMVFVTARPPIFLPCMHMFECCSLKHGLQKLKNFVFLKQNCAIWWILLGANLIKVMKTKISVLQAQPTQLYIMDELHWRAGLIHRPSSLALVKYGRGYILKTYAKCSWGCASGGILSVRCNAGPAEGPWKILKYRSNLRLYPVKFSNKLCIFRFIIPSIWPNFFDPPFYYGKLFGPPLSVTQNFFGPLHFAQPPHQSIYEHSLSKRLSSLWL